jgi:hypothetical protein
MIFVFGISKILFLRRNSGLAEPQGSNLVKAREPRAFAVHWSKSPSWFSVAENVVPVLRIYSFFIVTFWLAVLVSGASLRASLSSDLFCFIIGVETLAETDNIIKLEPDCLIEFNHRIVAAADLQIDLGASRCPKAALRFLHHASTDAGTLVIGMYCKIVDPTAMAVVSSHDSGNDLFV